MNTTKRILAGILAIIALGAIAFAIHLFMKKTEGSENTGFRAQVQQPSTGAPKWTMDGQHSEADYSSLKMAPHNATIPQDENNATESNASTENATITPVDEGPTTIREDDTVTFAFIESLARYIVARFQPASDGKAPYTKISFRDLNMHFGRKLDGMNISSEDPKEMRTQVLEYVFTPASLKSIYSLYAASFVEQLSETAENIGAQQTPPLTRPDLSDMFRVNAAQLIHVGKIFKAIGNDPEIIAETAKYIQAVRAVERSNVLFQESLAGDSSKDTRSAASNRLKNTIRERERIRNNIVASVRKNCGNCSDEDMFYISMWAYRRTLGNADKLNAFEVAGNSLQDLADRFKAKAIKLMQVEQE